MIELLVTIVSILVCLFIFMFVKLREFYRDKSLRDKVVWTVTGGSGISMWAEVSNAQIELKLPTEYRISGDKEWSFVKEIIEEYKKDLVISYIKGYLKVVKSKYVIPSRHYFMLTLQSFLGEHQCDYEFLDHNMHEKRINYTEYGSWGATHYDAAYSLTEFAIVFHKLYYISYLFCKNSNVINSNGDNFTYDNSIKKILDTKQIEISRL